MSAAPADAAPITHEIQIAIAPLDTLLSEDLGAAAETARQLFTSLTKAIAAAARGKLDAASSHRLARAQMAQVALYDSALETDAWPSRPWPMPPRAPSRTATTASPVTSAAN